MLASYIKHNPDIVAKFWAQVDRSGGPDACWPWLGKKTKEDARGYCWFLWSEYEDKPCGLDINI